MASFSRGQLPARHTKVVDENQRPLKTGSPGCGSLKNDGTSSKPYCKGRDVAEDSQGGAFIECCGSKRCKTCDHIFVGSIFSSNVTGKFYSVKWTGEKMNCGNVNVSTSNLPLILLKTTQYHSLMKLYSSFYLLIFFHKCPMFCSDNS